MSTTLKYLAKVFFTPQTEPRTTLETILWWEKRRPIYNLFVGVVGIFSFILFLVICSQPGMLKPGEDAVEPLAVLLAPLPINLCYTLGWITEVLSLRTKNAVYEFRGPERMKLGIVFSLFAIFLPLRMAVSAWAMLQIFGR